MSNIFNPDFRDFIRALDKCDVDYILVGGYAVILHGYSRTTGDMDIWVRRTSENYHKVVKAFKEFGMPVFDMSEENFLNNPAIDVFTFGVPPVCIDLMTTLKGLEFESAFQNCTVFQLEDISVRVIHINDLILAKMKSNRAKDQDDISHLGFSK
ncbi:MAG: nucleotidyltransferase [Saprospiraceae bacterium]|nr:nucleotidyltransferase [Saprospiraceae bacterium]